MHRRALLVGLLALSVVTAGCNLGGTGTVGPGTPATDATGGLPTETSAGPFGGASPPPGADVTGITDVEGLLSAHAGNVNGTSATVEMGFSLTVNGTGQNASLRGKVVPSADRGWMRVSFQDGVGTYYTEDGTTYFREIVDEDTQYGTTGEISAVPARPRFGADERVRTALRSAEWTPVGTVERGGRTLFEYRATSVDPPDVNATADATVSSSGRLLVDARGVVHLVAVRTTVETDRGTVRYALRVTLSDVGSTTVERPDWFDLAAGS